MTLKSCFSDVGLAYPDLVIARLLVKFGEYYSSMQFIHEFICDWDRVPVGNGFLIQNSVINAELPGTILLLGQQGWTRIRAL